MHEFLNEQAARCMQLSRACFDLETSTRLRRMAEEFKAKAAEIAARSASQPSVH